MQIEITIPKKIDNEDNWCLTHAEIFKSKIHLWLFFASLSKLLPYALQ